MVLENNSNVKNIYIIDHWFYNRSKQNIISKINRYFRTGIIEYKKIKKKKFDIAIELNSHYPNLIPYTKLLNIPIRLGYSTGGFGGLLTHRINYIPNDQHELEIKLNLLKFLSIKPQPQYNNSFQELNGLKIIKQKIKKKFSDEKILDLNENNYFVIHIGAGSRAREWPLKKWKSLSKKLINENYRLVFTGKGKRENSLIDKVICQERNCINLCDLLNWNELSTIIKYAKLLIGVDSMSMHLSSILQTPAIGIYSGIGNNKRWKPFYHQSVFITKSVPCSPCYKKNGCQTMECIQNISVNEVFEQVQIINN